MGGARRNITKQADKELSASFNVPGLGQIIRLEDPNGIADAGKPLRAQYFIANYIIIDRL
jgi:hypothetical protein